MTDYLTLTEFVPGTKAKAQEVNANFTLIKDALATKSTINGDSSKTFEVAAATQNSHAVNQGQLLALEENLQAEIDKKTTKFCAQSGNVTNGKADLFSFSVLEITPKIGGTYSDLIALNYLGEKITAVSATKIDMTGKADGVHNIFINKNAELYTLKNTVYKQASRPTMIDGDVWLDTSVEPIRCIKYNGTSDSEFLDVPLGYVSIAGNIITKIKTLDFNQNGHNVTWATSGHRFPKYGTNVVKVWNTDHEAECDGWVHITGLGDYAHPVILYVNTSQICYSNIQGSTGIQISASGFAPITKGDVYKGSGGSQQQVLCFYPVKGVN